MIFNSFSSQKRYSNLRNPQVISDTDATEDRWLLSIKIDEYILATCLHVAHSEIGDKISRYYNNQAGVKRFSHVMMCQFSSSVYDATDSTKIGFPYW